MVRIFIYDTNFCLSIFFAKTYLREIERPAFGKALFSRIEKNRLSMAACSFVRFSVKYGLYFIFAWGCSDLVISALDFRSEGQWFEAQSLPSCCFFRKPTLSLSTQVYKMDTDDILLGVNLEWTSIPSRG